MVLSPCINVCRIDPATGWCEGCLRSIDEICRWRDMSDRDRMAVLGQLERRKPALTPNPD